MRKLTTVAIGAACLVLGAGGATLYTHAATGPAFYAVYEANVTDEDAYSGTAGRTEDHQRRRRRFSPADLTKPRWIRHPCRQSLRHHPL